jgi:hypothetical protein
MLDRPGTTCPHPAALVAFLHESASAAEREEIPSVAIAGRVAPGNDGAY